MSVKRWLKNTEAAYQWEVRAYCYDPNYTEDALCIYGGVFEMKMPSLSECLLLADCAKKTKIFRYVGVVDMDAFLAACVEANNIRSFLSTPPEDKYWNDVYREE